MAWLADWNKRVKLTLDSSQVDASLTDFPVLIYLSTSSGIDGTDVSFIFDELASDANRKKIAVTTSDGTTQCYVEIERWDTLNEQAWLHVKVPSVSDSVDTELYLYYDASHADNTTYVGDSGDTSAQNVWDSNFVGVWHMAQDPNGDVANVIKDSTSNGNPGDPHGSMTSADLVDGKVGKGIDFDGSDDYISIQDNSSLDITGQLTLEAIFKSIATPSADEGIVAKYYAASGFNERSYRLVFTSNNKLKITLSDDGTTNAGHYVSFEGNTSVTDNALHHAAATYIPSTSATIYLDGTQDGQENSSIISSLYSGSADLWLGIQHDASNSDLAFNGLLDECRVSNTARSDAWINATYYSLWDSLVTFGGEEEDTSLEGTLSFVNSLRFEIESTFNIVNSLRFEIESTFNIVNSLKVGNVFRLVNDFDLTSVLRFVNSLKIEGSHRLVNTIKLADLIRLVNSLKIEDDLSLVNSLNTQVSDDVCLVLDVLSGIKGSRTFRLDIDELAKFNDTLGLINHILSASSGVTQCDYYFDRSHGI